MGWSKQLKLIVSFSVVLLFMPVNADAASGIMSHLFQWVIQSV